MDLKGEIGWSWPMTGLLDVLKETALDTQFLDCLESSASREALAHDVRNRRLLLALYALGTNAGLKRIAAGVADVSIDELAHVHRRYIDAVALRAACARGANATLAIRNPQIWGAPGTTCASDSTKFGAVDRTLMTQWHARHGGRGVMIYWHVERRATCIYSQLERSSSSEVAAIVEGVLRHCTDMEIQRQYVDFHGQSAVGFAFCHLLGFELAPRLKAIARQKLVLASASQRASLPDLAPILSGVVDGEEIARQYDEMVKYAAAMQHGTADPESILRRFSRGDVMHPTYKALAELGRAIKTAFLCRYLRLERFRREIHEGLNVVESWNSANGFVFFGKGGEIATNRVADQGADVIKIENPTNGGDMSRGVGPFFFEEHDSLFFDALNRNKKSLTLDLSREEGRKLLHELVAGADALASNLRGDVPARLRLTYDALGAFYPRIVRAHLSACGREGPRADWPGFDYLIQAEAGYFSLTGEPEAPPARFGLSMVGFMTELGLAYALLSGLTSAHASGVGRDMDLSLFNMALFNTSYLAAWYLREGHCQGRLPRSAHPSLTPCQLYRRGIIYLVARST